MKYWLKLYDENLINFTMNGNGINFNVDINFYAGDRRDVMPIGIDGTSESLSAWLKSRIIPPNRAYADNILNCMGFTAGTGDTAGIIDFCKGLSINDSYWVVPEDFDGYFSKYNLYENKFPEFLALTSLTGESIPEHEARQTKISPEFTTGGTLPKAWRRVDGKIILYKSGIWEKYEGTDDFPEPYSEYYACQLADRMGIPQISYGLSRWKGILCSTCELFTDADTSYVPISGAVRGNPQNTPDYYLKVSEWYKSYDYKNGTDLYDNFASMITFDALIYDGNRHPDSFGVLRNNKSGRIIASAPIYNNGKSLFNHLPFTELEKIDEYRKAYINHFKNPFDETVKKFCSIKQNQQLQKLIGFKFKKDKHYNWPPERLQIIQEFIRKRVLELLDVTPAQSHP